MPDWEAEIFNISETKKFTVAIFKRDVTAQVIVTLPEKYLFAPEKKLTQNCVFHLLYKHFFLLFFLVLFSPYSFFLGI